MLKIQLRAMRSIEGKLYRAWLSALVVRAPASPEDGLLHLIQNSPTEIGALFGVAWLRSYG
jgi:hypothetical protein